MARSTKQTTTARKTASRKARSVDATLTQAGWRQAVEQAVSTGKGAVEFVQKQGLQALEQAQRRSTALSLQARQAAEEKLEAVAVKVVSSWDQVEQAASQRVGRTLNRLGVPSQKDIEKLTKSVSKLSAQIEQLAAAAPKAARSRSTARRAAA